MRGELSNRRATSSAPARVARRGARRSAGGKKRPLATRSRRATCA